MQVVFHHVLPLALPGILTGTIIGMARALGETAPLLMIGMRAFIASPPGGITDRRPCCRCRSSCGRTKSTAASSRRPRRRSSSCCLPAAMNGLAIYLRNKFENRW